MLVQPNIQMNAIQYIFCAEKIKIVIQFKGNGRVAIKNDEEILGVFAFVKLQCEYA